MMKLFQEYKNNKVPNILSDDEEFEDMMANIKFKKRSKRYRGDIILNNCIIRSAVRHFFLVCVRT